MQTNNNTKEKFKAVDFMRRVRDELGKLYFADKDTYLAEVKRAMQEFKKRQKMVYTE
ncbi:MAG: hypothetical protein HY960_12125 [Ignavibacteriae bacterium]|nr:hypothetical protein [Ignavibacteriota bacterium]